MNWYGLLYCHTNLANGKKYWGQTVQNPSRRWRKGERYKNQPLFYRAIKKYGWDNFQHTIVTYCLDKETLDAAEIFWIKATRSNERDFGYNLKEGGSHGKHSEETKRKIGKAGLGKKHSEESKQKMSQAQIGKKFTDEHLKNMSLSRIGKHPSNESKQKMSDSQKGRKHSDETKKKMSDWQIGKKLSEETKKKISDSHKNRKKVGVKNV
jgi:group I intron endonuclease